MKNKIYALYKGEELLAMGTIQEIADKMNVAYRTIYFYAMPTYKRRTKGHFNRRILIEC